MLVYHSWLHGFHGLTDGGKLELGRFTSVIPDLAFGVTLFFSLSGFLLYRPFAASLLGDRPLPSVRVYARNRGLRILPAYWVILLVTAVLMASVSVRFEGRLVPGGLRDAPELLLAVFFAQNYVPGTVGLGIGPAWSLAVEVVFYLCLPLLAVMAAFLVRRARSASQRRLAALSPAVLLLCLGLSGKAVAAFALPGPPSQFGPNWHSAIELSFWCQADLFAFGIILAVLHVEIQSGRVRLPGWWRAPTIVGAIGAYVIVARTTVWGDQLSYKPSNTLMAAACTLLLALVVLPTASRSKPSLLLRFLEQPPVVAVGLVSYSIFLWHEPIITWLGVHGLGFAGRSGFAANTVIVLAVTLLLSALTYRWVECPALRLKAHRPRPAVEEGLLPEQLAVIP